MEIQAVIKSQYLSALQMLQDNVEKCPQELWLADSPTAKFWHIAYHAVFYTHLYLSPTGADFNHWEKHKENYQFMGPTPWPPHETPKIDQPYQKKEILEYIEFCKNIVKKAVPELNISADSGFDWLPMEKLELQIYNIRHLMQHIGELSERLGSQAGLEVNWVGLVHDE